MKENVDATIIIDRLVLVEWIDAAAHSSWEEMPEVMKWSKEKFVVREVGWVIEDNKDMLVLTSQLGDENLIGNRTKIPKPWILSTKTVKVCKKKGA